VGIATRIGLVVIVPTALVGAALTPQVKLPHVLPSRPMVAMHDLPGTTDSTRQDPADNPVDLYGNEVTDAVAKYKLDAAGTLYELHSPQTEVPHLGSPKT
jgi:hypothetical protein